MKRPEGPNIGLINSLADLCPRINQYGFIESRRTARSRTGKVIDSDGRRLRLSAIEEGREKDYTIAQANAADCSTPNGFVFTEKTIGELPLADGEFDRYGAPDGVEQREIDLHVDVSPKQLVSRRRGVDSVPRKR